jgi:hypothetical protein
MHDSVVKLDMAIDRMNKARAEEVEILNKQIRKFNDFHTVENVGVSSVNYNGDTLSWWKHEWAVKNQVADKLTVAIALLDQMHRRESKKSLWLLPDEVS